MVPLASKGWLLWSGSNGTTFCGRAPSGHLTSRQRHSTSLPSHVRRRFCMESMQEKEKVCNLTLLTGGAPQIYSSHFHLTHFCTVQLFAARVMHHIIRSSRGDCLCVPWSGRQMRMWMRSSCIEWTGGKFDWNIEWSIDFSIEIYCTKKLRF